MMVPVQLDAEFIARASRRIEQAIVPCMAKIYPAGPETFAEVHRPGLKLREQVFSYFDYEACRISVLAGLAAGGDQSAARLIEKIMRNTDYYRSNIFGRELTGSPWRVPLRRLLFHLALAYRKLEPILNPNDKAWFHELIEEQVQFAIEHNRRFFPGEKNLHLLPVNNHTAIFMQAIYYCGKIFNHPEWVELTRDFAERYYASGHPDGYFEEVTNEARESGPSLVYTRLTVGCLYDVLDGKSCPRDKFVLAGNFYRSFLNYDYKMIPIADERTNATEAAIGYGIACHSLTSQGRSYIVENIERCDFSLRTPEALAVIHHELGLMVPGDCAVSENQLDGNSRLTLPLGVVRANGFTAGISALRALNRVIHPGHDYHLDQQNMVYLAHAQAGVILTGFKSRSDPAYSTFRIGDDAYTVRTGELEMGVGWAEAHLHYATFEAMLRWEIGVMARLIFRVNSPRTVTTSLPISDPAFLWTKRPHALRDLNGFSPYSAGNKADPVKALVLDWQKELVLEFLPGKP